MCKTHLSYVGDQSFLVVSTLSGAAAATSLGANQKTALDSKATDPERRYSQAVGSLHLLLCCSRLEKIKQKGALRTICQ